MSKKLKDLIKTIQFKTGKNIEEIAKVLNYSRPHLSRMINSETENDELLEHVMLKFGHLLEQKKEEPERLNIKIPDTNNDVTGKYIAVLEKLLNQEAKEIKDCITDLEKKVAVSLTAIQENQRLMLYMVDL